MTVRINFTAILWALLFGWTSYEIAHAYFVGEPASDCVWALAFLYAARLTVEYVGDVFGVQIVSRR